MVDQEIRQILFDRREQIDKHGRYQDDHKLALILPPGCMRGIEIAGFVMALHRQGLLECFDTYIGISVGAFILLFLKDPRLGIEVFKNLTGKSFINKNVTRFKALAASLTSQQNLTAKFRKAAFNALNETVSGSKDLWHIATQRLAKIPPMVDMDHLRQVIFRIGPQILPNKENIIITTDLKHGISHAIPINALSLARQIETAIASGFLPLLARGIPEFNGRSYGDGAFTNPLGLDIAGHQKCTHAFVISSAPPRELSTFNSAAERLVLTAMRWAFPRTYKAMRALNTKVCRDVTEIEQTGQHIPKDIDGKPLHPIKVSLSHPEKRMMNSFETSSTGLMQGFIRGFMRGMEWTFADHKPNEIYLRRNVAAYAQHALGRRRFLKAAA